MKRLVVDANTLVSGVGSRTKNTAPVLIVDAMLDTDFEAVVCPRLLAEIARGLRKPYFRKRVPAERIDGIVAAVESIATIHPDPTAIEPLLRDPDDDYLVALAHQAGADAIVTGDKDLLEHPGGLQPPAIDARAACKLLGLI